VSAAFDPLRPLAGIRVVDLTSVVMGPFATQILGDLGAEVTVVETPQGDANRHMGPGPAPDVSGVALNLLRNKRSIVLDIRTDEGYDVLLSMVAAADVFVTNLRPGSRRRARITYDDLRAVNPSLVYCAAVGHRPDSADADTAAYDDIVQASTGFVDVNRRAGLPPVLAPVLVADKVSGMAIAQAVTAGLFHRERTGEGVESILAMDDVMRGFLLVEHGAAAIAEPPQGPSGYPRLMSTERAPLPTTDGLVTILAYERHHFEGLIRIGGRTEMLDDPRFMTRLGRLENIDELYREYRRIAEGYSTAEFLAACQREGVPAHEVVTLDDVVAALPLVDHPDLGAYRVTPPVVPTSDPGAPPRRPAPHLGENAVEVLTELGYTPEVIDALMAAGVVGRYGQQP